MLKFKFSAIVLAILVISMCALPAKAQDSSDSAPQNSSTTSYSPTIPRIGLQFGSGLLIGGASGALTALAGVAAAPKGQGGSGAGFGSMGYAFVGGILGYTFGSALGVHVVANSPSYEASYGNILIGTSLGTVAGLGIFATLGANSAGVAGAVAFLTPLVGGVIANKFSISKRKPTSTALLNIYNGNTTVSTPSIQVSEVDHFNQRANGITKSYSPTVELLNISL